MAIKFRLKSLIEQKEIVENRRITYRDIAFEADVSTNTLTQMANQKKKQRCAIVSKFHEYLSACTNHPREA